VAVGGSADHIQDVAGRFDVGGSIVGVTTIPGGHINDSYRIDARAPGGTIRSFLLQRINRTVFTRPDLVMENVVRVARHLARRDPRYPAIVAARDGGDWITDAPGEVWRMFVFVPGTKVRQRVESAADARAVGRAFGEFLRLLADAPPSLHETIAGFHDTRGRYARLEAARRADAYHRADLVAPELDAVLDARAVAEVLPPLMASGALPTRVVHNDAKIGNVLLDLHTGEPVCVIDLDTVMPGSLLYDFGDLVRSSTSPTAEDAEDLETVGVRPDLFEALTRAYLEAAGPVLTSEERDLLVFSGRLITMEQAIRFLTDHLEGDRYYRIERPGHNLIRCRAQLALYRSLTEQEASLARIVLASTVPAL
jgi:Ser/Thr protein kinase RdoA (MazF antagonist)